MSIERPPLNTNRHQISQRLAADLFGALCAEAEQWAGDEKERELIDRLDNMRPDKALEAIAERNLSPSHLHGPVEAVLCFLDPETYGDGRRTTNDGADEHDVPDDDSLTTADASTIFAKAAQAKGWTRTNLGLMTQVSHGHYTYRVLVPHSVAGAQAVIYAREGYGGTDFHATAQATWSRTCQLVEAGLAATRMH